ncbi:tetratricopeptide repeat protein [Colwellia sp. BRX8-7]|jgi:tetratricopeptide (TPR) repeat protein|uniref:tetratricopeptide repeat protein n=1 Tax=Colwellia sp. BRX8-7 TaxID=2759833 RepID=UPI0015F4C0BB|nr:tetratricopeptide repeat protein [Colwellia sp. BRX8-7]MBA6338746.1 tetratricopeptide repeat protein [Colwellia sp. BRX8-7]
MSSKLRALIKQLDKDPRNLDLINEVAMGYYQTPDMITNDEDLKLFRKAYLIEKTVKTTNNLAWLLYIEYGNTDQAITIIEECIAINPNSYFPYNLLGYILLDEERFDEALYYLSIAENKSEARDVVNNIGVAYFKLGNYEQAHKYFKKGSLLQDVENRSLYNLAVTALALQNIEETEELLVSLKGNLQNEFIDPVCNYEIASIYVALNQYEEASNLTIELGLNGIDLADWPELAYSLFRSHQTLFDKTISELIAEREEWIVELESEHEDWEDYSSSEKLERIEEFRTEILIRRNLKSSFEKIKPETKLETINEYCGCLLFDCKQHNNPLNDL